MFAVVADCKMAKGQALEAWMSTLRLLLSWALGCTQSFFKLMHAMQLITTCSTAGAVSTAGLLSQLFPELRGCGLDAQQGMSAHC